MIPLSKTTVHRFTPAHYADRTAAPVYLLAPLSLADRTRLDAEVMRAGASRVTTEDVRHALREAATELLEPAEAEAVHAALERLQQIQAEREEHAERVRDAELLTEPPPEWTPPEDEAAAATVVAEFERVAARAHRGYANARADAGYYLDVLVQLTVRYAVRGIEQGVAYEARGGVLTEACLEAIPPLDRLALTTEAMRLARLGRDAQGNS